MLAKRVRARRFMISLPFVVGLGAATLGIALGSAARAPGGAGWIFAVLVLTAAVVAIAQQTLP
jgi:hypothetical protein